MVRRDCHIYLVPGFFGFNTIGSFDYFRGISRLLRVALRRHGLEATIIECDPGPTAFIKYRAADLARQIEAAGGTRAKEIHLVGHSTGGLDVRQLLSPHTHGISAGLAGKIRKRARSAVLISTPHRGTRLAHFFMDIQGRAALKMIAREASTRGRIAIYAGAKLLDLVARADDVLGNDDTTLDMLSRHLLGQLTLDPKDPFWAFLRRIAADQGAMVQLTTEWMDHFNATVMDHPKVRYSSIVTAAPPPLGRGIFDLARRRPHLLSLGYSLLHTIVAWMPSPPAASLPVDDALLVELRKKLPVDINMRTNDGIVPTLSQPYGKILGAELADHLDIIGQFERPKTSSYHDWLPSGSRFNEEAFTRVWRTVAEEIAVSSKLR
ncbi:MAG: alpha/beta fold hydrolase [Deltaproteobacteria bacterium]|nr:alpha/beta fold hydrolase [Deltaproteobacteria bacterium]